VIGLILLVASVTLELPHTGGTLTYTGKDVTCKQVEEAMKKLTAKSHGKLRPIPCHEKPPVAHAKSN
jgi:hypothetical protein